MTTRRRLGVIFGGYAAAWLAAFAACELLTLIDSVRDPGGMAAAGELFLFIGLFGLFALVPTALALWFLRPVRKFWTLLSVASLMLAATGPVAAIALPRIVAPQMPGLVVLGFVALMRVLGTPLLGLGFLITVLIAPTRRPRQALFAAAVIEGTVGTYAFFCFAVLGHWLL
jgi:hypothetical protein